MSSPSDNTSQEEPEPVIRIILRLYVAGGAPNSLRAVDNLTAICKEYLPDRYQIEIVDVMQDPLRALADKVLITPTLLKLSPAPTCSIFGSLSDRKMVLLALGIERPI